MTSANSSCRLASHPAICICDLQRCDRQSVKFYLVAMIFLLFDIEVAVLYPWAMALRDLGWNGFVQVLLFMALLLAGYIYVWRKGVLEWGNEIADRRSTIGD